MRNKIVIKPEYYLRLSPEVSLKALEAPYIYDSYTDELYEVNEEAIEFLINCDGAHRAGELTYEDEFAKYCIGEGLIQMLEEPEPRILEIFRSPIPSLRYLELQITRRCNLACRHCYLGKATNADLPAAKVIDAISQLEKMGGLRVMISGGEPLMHPEWEAINAELERFEIRRVLLSNGDLITPELVERLNVQEVQISLDGMEAGHEAMRGKGSFKKAVKAAKRVTDAGLDLSIATMVHQKNLDELEDMKHFVKDLDAIQWSIDVPCVCGRLTENPEEVLTSAKDGAAAMELAYGGGYHGKAEGFACGFHLATLTVDGKLAKCGFYENEPLGTLEEGLATAWKRKKTVPLEKMECGACEVVEDCGGGCRFRAPDEKAPDPIMCAMYGVANKSKKKSSKKA